jgi:hypothetical protein
MDQAQKPDAIKLDQSPRTSPDEQPSTIAPTKIGVSGQQSSVGRVEAPASQARAAWVPSKPVLHRTPTDDCSQLPVAARRTAATK